MIIYTDLSFHKLIARTLSKLVLSTALQCPAGSHEVATPSGAERNKPCLLKHVKALVVLA